MDRRLAGLHRVRELVRHVQRDVGRIGGNLVFLIWLRLASVAVLLGAEFTAEPARSGAMAAGLEPPSRIPYLPQWDRGD